ncbi:MAG: riboflavin synthase, alpha subunit [Verrucomicrobiaceae bacterium]|nr:riboflavin synthase, alpha subunit [Verrucomicrobiaceae bacterium]
MFTGLVESTAPVISMEPRSGGSRLRLYLRDIAAEIKDGDSIAVNGCCLTATGIEKHVVAFDLLEQTLRVTNLGDLREGDLVNIERAMLAGARLGGHFVQGHVDSTVEILTWREEGADWRLEVSLPDEARGLVIPKGSICLDGISLTAAEVLEDRVVCWIIPHTREITHLITKQAGQRMNVEWDMLAKHVRELVRAELSRQA